MSTTEVHFLDAAVCLHMFHKEYQLLKYRIIVKHLSFDLELLSLETKLEVP